MPHYNCTLASALHLYFSVCIFYSIFSFFSLFMQKCDLKNIFLNVGQGELHYQTATIQRLKLFSLSPVGLCKDMVIQNGRLNREDLHQFMEGPALPQHFKLSGE